MKKKNWFLYGKRVAEILFFLAALYLLLNVCSGILVPKKQQSGAVKSFYDQKKETVDVVFLGSSHSYRSVLPMQLWEDYGISAVNLGTSSQPMIATYYLMKEAVRTQKPKAFVLDLYACSYSSYKKQNLMSFHSAVDFIPLNFTKLSLWWEQLRKDFNLAEQLEFLFPVIKYHNRWSELEETDFHVENYKKGGSPTAKIEAQSPGKKVDQMAELDHVVEKYLLKMCTLCQKEQIPLVVYTAPMAKDKSYKRICKKVNTGNRLCRENGVIVFDMQDVMEGMEIDFRTDFYNSQHLNVNGARKLTAWMAGELLQRFEFTDHRGDPRYISWESALPRYQNDMENLIYQHKKQLTGELELEETDGL